MTAVSPITITPTAAPTASNANTAASSLASLSGNQQTFLTLLTTQLKNQDPTQPMDPSQFTQQLVEYSQVEQQINTNSLLSQMVTAQNTTQTSAALSYIGMQVDAPGSSFTYSGQPVDLGYGLPTAAANAAITITDQSGNVVWTGAADTAAGSYNLTWSGTDMNGNAVSNGTYNIGVTAVDSTGTPINGTTAVPGIVQGIQTDNGALYLTVNGTSIPASSVTNATPAATTASN